MDCNGGERANTLTLFHNLIIIYNRKETHLVSYFKMSQPPPRPNRASTVLKEAEPALQCLLRIGV